MVHNANHRHRRVLANRQAAFTPTWLGPDPVSTAAVVNPVPDPIVSSSPVVTAVVTAVVTSVVTPVAPPAVPLTTTSTSTTSSTTTSTSTSSTPILLLPSSSTTTTSSTTSTTSTTSTSSTSIQLTFGTVPPVSATLITTTPTSGIVTYASKQASSVKAPVQTTRSSIPLQPSISTPSTTSSHSLAAASTSSTTPSATSTAVPAGTLSTTTIIGVAAAGFVGLLVIGGIVAYIVRQCRKSDNAEDFNRRSFIRNSVLLSEDQGEKPLRGTAAALALARSNTRVGPSPDAGAYGGPRPPTMIQRHYNAPAAQYGGFKPGQYVNGNGNGNGYPAPPSASYFPAGAMAERQAYGPAQPLPTSPVSPQEMYHQYQQQHQAGLARQPTYGSAQSAEQADLNREPSFTKGQVGRKLTSVTPFQAQQYAEISKLVSDPLPSQAKEQQFAAQQAYAAMARQPSPPRRSPPTSMVSSAHPMDNDDSRGSPSPPLLPPKRDLVSPFQRIDSTPPVLPPLNSHASDASLARHLHHHANFRGDSSAEPSRTGTPTDPNPQYVYYPRAQSPQARPGASASASYPTLLEPQNAPRSPRFHSGVSARSHMGMQEYAAPAAASGSGRSLTVPEEPVRRLSVRNSVGDRFSMIDVEDVYGGI